MSPAPESAPVSPADFTLEKEQYPSCAAVRYLSRDGWLGCGIGRRLRVFRECRSCVNRGMACRVGVQRSTGFLCPSIQNRSQGDLNAPHSDPSPHHEALCDVTVSSWECKICVVRRVRLSVNRPTSLLPNVSLENARFAGKPAASCTAAGGGLEVHTRRWLWRVEDVNRVRLKVSWKNRSHGTRIEKKEN